MAIDHVAAAWLSRRRFLNLNLFFRRVAGHGALLVARAYLSGFGEHPKWRTAMIPLTFPVANGLAFGITAYKLLKVPGGKLGRPDRLPQVLSPLLVARFVWLPTG